MTPAPVVRSSAQRPGSHGSTPFLRWRSNRSTSRWDKPWALLNLGSCNDGRLTTEGWAGERGNAKAGLRRLPRPLFLSHSKASLMLMCYGQKCHANNLAKLCEDPVAKAAVLADMDELGTEAKVSTVVVLARGILRGNGAGFEYAKNIHLVPELFTLQNDLLTPTFKIKRPQAKAFFEKEIARMYAELAAKERALPTRSKL
eukprot:SM000054S18031  [mRNA]  locus=s54:42970:44031:+ [translate_table: standard]